MCRAVPRPAGAGAGGDVRRARPARDQVQVRQVHRRAAAAAGRHAGRRRARAADDVRPATACRSARRSSCATTCSACSATRPRPASRPATTCARASGRCSSRWRSSAARPRRPRRCCDGLGDPRLGRGGRGRAARGDRRVPARSAAVERLIAEQSAAARSTAVRRRRAGARRCWTSWSSPPPRAVRLMRTVTGPTDHVVVVGAGLGGLSAALRLAGAGRQVTVLEREPVPGGRAGLLADRRLLLRHRARPCSRCPTSSPTRWTAWASRWTTG